ncbi:NAD(P)-binding domain-containing protein [Nocardia brasiliensis]|uniref:NAD(P)-binding domain-containing protein n=1 Tax=Nocardia brasiliensis TaxID=37326 RepID=UPI0024583392|nr:NAD(P)-binding domain-containing protein [Nocardia brasiliensis]
MRIGIIGAGAMARALGGGWVAAGHEVLVGARSAAAAQESAAAIGARDGSVRAAAEFGDVVLLALPVDALDEVLRPLAGLLAGRTLVDSTNAFAPDTPPPPRGAGVGVWGAGLAARHWAIVPGAHRG